VLYSCGVAQAWMRGRRTGRSPGGGGVRARALLSRSDRLSNTVWFPYSRQRTSEDTSTSAKLTVTRLESELCPLLSYSIII